MVIKPLGKNVGGFLLRICALTSLDYGEHFYRGYMNNLRSFGDIHKNALFKSFVAFLRKDGTKNEEKT